MIVLLMKTNHKSNVRRGDRKKSSQYEKYSSYFFDVKQILKNLYRSALAGVLWISLKGYITISDLKTNNFDLQIQ